MENTTKAIIAGGRDFDNYKAMCEKLDAVMDKFEGMEVVCGMAKGADLLGKKWAESKGIKVHEFPADWTKNGKSAGPIRNQQMIDFSDYLIVFWDHQSRGTGDVLTRATKKGMGAYIVRY